MNLLAPLGWIYGAGAAARNALYDRGLLRSYSLGAKTISVGNITTGGTGKTPLVALVAEILAAEDEKVCVLSRGYGRENPEKRVLVSDRSALLVDTRAGGDEPVELAQKLLGKAIVVADADRLAAGRWAKEEFGVTAFVLDDGFQHRRVRRDIDVVCIDATTGFSNGKLLPHGPLRESIKYLTRADVIVLTRAGLSEDTDQIEHRVLSLAPNAKLFRSNFRLTGCLPVSDAVLSGLKEIKKKTAFVFCGLGNPNAFARQLEREGFEIVGKRFFPDHHSYTLKDAIAIERLAASGNAEVLLTTAKDAVKLKELKFSMPCYAVIGEQVLNDEEGFKSLLISA